MYTYTVTAQPTSISYLSIPQDSAFICSGSGRWRSTILGYDVMQCERIKAVTLSPNSSVNGQALGYLTWDTFQLLIPELSLLFATVVVLKVIEKTIN